MMILPLVILTFLRLQYVSSTFNPSLIFAYWTSEENEYGKYQNSLHNLLGTLTSLTSNHGFYNFTTTFPKTPNQLHGLYLCLGDVDPQACRSCVNSGKNDILNYYGHGREALVWYNDCMVRYSNESFLGKFDERNWMTSLWGDSKIKGSRIHFMKILKDTMKSLAIQASNSQNQKKFASKVINKFSMFHSLYAKVQCTPDLVASDCYRCLTNANQKLLGMRGSTNGQVLQRSCMAEYKTLPFTSNKVNSLPYPSSPEATNSTQVGLIVRFERSPFSNKTINSSSTSSSRAISKPTVIKLEGSDPDDADGSE